MRTLAREYLLSAIVIESRPSHEYRLLIRVELFFYLAWDEDAALSGHR